MGRLCEDCLLKIARSILSLVEEEISDNEAAIREVEVMDEHTGKGYSLTFTKKISIQPDKKNAKKH